MKKAYKYGIELETVMQRFEYDRVIEAIRGQNLPYIFTGDSSISTGNDEEGVEIIASRPLHYTELERSMKALSKILIKHGVQVNQTTGFHVHMSNKRFFNSKNLKKIVFTFASIEDVLMATQPRSRYNNTYCQRLLSKYINDYGRELPKAKEALITELGRTGRYYTLNLNAMQKHGTIECRLHAGTIDSTKVLAWVDLLEAIYTYSLTKYNHSNVLELFNMGISDEKISKVFGLLGISEKLVTHFTNRIQRFGFEKLKRQQEGAIQAMRIAPEMLKLKKKWEVMQNDFNAVSREYANATEVLRGSSY